MSKAAALAVGIAFVLGASTAHAVAVGYVGDIAIEIGTLPPVVIPGAGTITVNGSGAFGHLTQLGVAAGVFQTAGFVLPVTDPAAAPIKGIQVTAANGAGSFNGVGGAGFGGTMPIQGVSKVCLFGACSAAVANLNVPLNVAGQGGFAQVTAAVNLTVIGAPWTTATAAVGTLTAMGGAAPASNTGAPGGTLLLVTPVFVSTNIGASAVVPVFAFFSVQLVPEAGTLTLLAVGIAGLVAHGRRLGRAERGSARP